MELPRLPDKRVICCVKQGSKYDNRYVRRLQSGIKRHLPNAEDYIFLCFTDAAVPGVICEPLPMDLPGWWAKVGLFDLRMPLIYFDLDVVITGDLAPLLEWQGFGIIKDWWLPGFNSSVMVLTGAEGHVADDFERGDMQRLWMGDQQWVTEQMSGARTFPPAWFPSYKANQCQASVPPGALAVIMHGNPKPHECGGWVQDCWI